MADLYILVSISHQGKTTTAIALEKKLRSEGKRVACLQMLKGPYDVFWYLSEGCFHYSVPLEAAKSKADFEKWVPEGYDCYILEITISVTPKNAIYISLFDNINEVISFESMNDWKNAYDRYLISFWEKYYPGKLPIFLSFNWDVIHDRNVQRVITKTPFVIEGPYVDLQKVFHHIDKLAVESIQPKMKFSKGNKKVIAVGVFPAEYWDIFPHIDWYKFDYNGFVNKLRNTQYDLVIIGRCNANRLNPIDIPSYITVICYELPVYLTISERSLLKNLLHMDFPAIFSTIKNAPVGTLLPNDRTFLSGINNHYWVYTPYEREEPVWSDGNVIFCNGWILPQYLIRDGFLEVDL